MEANIDNNAPYIPLQNSSASPDASWRPLKLKGTLVFIIGSIVFLIISLVALFNINNQNHEPFEKMQKKHMKKASTTESILFSQPRGVTEGVSAKSNLFVSDSYNWTNAMLSWQRTSFHFQPQQNWMNDPNGPFFYKGWYHLFYQYNPNSAVWGNITWGHAVSRDLIHWLYLPIALFPDKPFDINGVWSGSATLLPDGKIIMLYTGDTDQHIQVQNLAYPANLSDPLLLDWVKYADNPVLVPPCGIGSKDFRDPTTAWIGPDEKWRVTIGSKVNKIGISLVYTTKDFIHFELNDQFLHAVPGTGMWECVDFYPISINGSNGLDTSVIGPGVKHVLKASLDDTKEDHYAIGRYFVENDTWVPDNPIADVGIGLKLDYGRYYASKTFYDQQKQRRVLWGWINESDSEHADLKKGWASLQTIPRTVVFDKKTGTNLLQWPVEEVESLRLSSAEFEEVLVKPGSIVPLDVGPATQLDIFAEFEIELLESKGIGKDNIGCGKGAFDRSALGPFGILAIANDQLSELTPIYFTLSSTSNDNSTTSFCVDETRSSKAPDVSKNIYGSKVQVFSDEKLSMRVLLKRIENSVHRQVTFCKRRAGLLKKAKELSVLCDAEIGLVIFSAHGKLYELTTKGTMQGVIERYLKYTRGTQAEAVTEPHPLDAKEETNVLKQEIETMQKGIRYLFGGGTGTMTMNELQVLEKNLEIWIYHVRSMKMNIMSQEIQALRDKEGTLKAANKYLQDMVMENTSVTNYTPFVTDTSYPLIIQDGIFQL